jgi:lipopolysaccharide export system permease protein
MKAKIDNVEKAYKGKNYHIVKYDMEFHKKFTLAVSCLVLFFIGAPFGAITRKGGLAWPIIYSVILFIIYWVLNITFQKLAKNGTVPMFWGMWMANIVLFPVGLYFTTRATKDLPMFSLKLIKRK